MHMTGLARVTERAILALLDGQRLLKVERANAAPYAATIN
jgi:hypothetical protein